jgi:hypothetical protein
MPREPGIHADTAIDMSHEGRGGHNLETAREAAPAFEGSDAYRKQKPENREAVEQAGLTI